MLDWTGSLNASGLGSNEWKRLGSGGQGEGDEFVPARDMSAPVLDDARVKVGCEVGDWMEIFGISWSRF